MDMTRYQNIKTVSMLYQEKGGIGKSIPDARKISLDPRDFPRASPSGNLLGLGKLSDGDGFPNTSLVLVEHGYSPFLDLSVIDATRRSGDNLH